MAEGLITRRGAILGEDSLGSFTWDANTSSPAAVAGGPSVPVVTAIHKGMKRCVINDSGVVQYYLDPADSTKKEDGSSSTLSGADGMVMVEIPRFYTKREVSGTQTTWSISAVPRSGFALHPAFTKDGVGVDYRYYGAYDACVFDVSLSSYISGLNRDDAVDNSPSVVVADDKLASVSGVFPIVGVSRTDCRTLASNRGTGWRQLDFTLFSAVQLLYLIEYQSFYSQNILGNGNTNVSGGYPTQSANQTDSPHSEAGKSNSLGNASTDTTSGAVSSSRNVAFMSYRGIENFYGNCWNWTDGIIVNPDGTASAGAGAWWWTNKSADFSDTVKTNMTQITAGAPTGSAAFVSAIAAVDNFFVATSVSGGSSSTYLTDSFTGSTSADRAVNVGGTAAAGAIAGAFMLLAGGPASFRSRDISARLAF